MRAHNQDNNNLMDAEYSKSEEAFESYLQRHVIDNQVHQLSRKERGFRIGLALIGAAWGAPWTTAAASAAGIFPASSAARAVFEKIFSAGIVLTVGIDGLWLMLEVGKILGSRSPEENAFLEQPKTRCAKGTRRVFPGILSFLSCISAVYATVKYNSGLGQLFGIVTFIDNYGSGFYGYSNFLEKVRGRCSRKSNHASLTRLQQASVNNVERILKEASPDLSSATDLARRILPTAEVKASEENPASSSCGRYAFQYTAAGAIAVSASLVGLFLVKEFLQKKIWDSIYFALTVAILAEIPVLVVTCISALSVFSALYTVLTCGENHEVRKDLVKDIYPCLSKILPFIVFAISLTAPSAAGFIAYDTFGKEDVGSGLQIIATVSLSLARLVFSNFTLNKLGDEFLLYCHEKLHGADDVFSKKIRLNRFCDVLRGAKLTLFKPFLPDAQGAEAGSVVRGEVVRPLEEGHEMSRTR